MTISSQQGERDLFEKWAKGLDLRASIDLGAYADLDVQFAWCGWQARAALAPLVLEQIHSSVHPTERSGEAVQRAVDVLHAAGGGLPPGASPGTNSADREARANRILERLDWLLNGEQISLDDFAGDIREALRDRHA